MVRKHYPSKLSANAKAIRDRFLARNGIFNSWSDLRNAARPSRFPSRWESNPQGSVGGYWRNDYSAVGFPTPRSLSKRPVGVNHGASSSSVRRQLNFVEPVEPVVDNVPGFDGRAGGGGRRRPRKGNGFARRVRRKRGRKIGKRLVRKTRARKRSRKASTKIQSKILNNGVYRTEYNSGTLAATSDRCLYFGHSNVVQQDMLYVFLSSLVKNVLQRAGCEVKQMADPIRGITIGDTLQIAYRTGNDSATVLFMTATVGSGGITTATAISGYVDLFFQQMLGLTNEDQIIFESIGLSPVVSVSLLRWTVINLRNAKVTFHLSAELSLENRTVIAGAGTEVTDVLAVKLVGKYYSGVGTGTHHLNDRDIAIPFVANSGTGMIAVAPGTGVNAIIRPVDHRMMSHVKKSGPFHVSSGQNWVSKLASKQVVRIDDVSRMLSLDNQPTYPLLKFGKFKMFGMEKQINNTGDVVTVGYTHRSTVGCQVKYFKARMTAVSNV